MALIDYIMIFARFIILPLSYNTLFLSKVILRDTTKVRCTL